MSPVLHGLMLSRNQTMQGDSMWSWRGWWHETRRGATQSRCRDHKLMQPRRMALRWRFLCLSRGTLTLLGQWCRSPATLLDYTLVLPVDFMSWLNENEIATTEASFTWDPTQRGITRDAARHHIRCECSLSFDAAADTITTCYCWCGT